MPTYTLPTATATSVCSVALARDFDRTSAALSGVLLAIRRDGDKGTQIVVAASDGHVLVEHAIQADTPPAGPDVDGWTGILAMRCPNSRRAWADAAKACRPSKARPNGATLTFTPGVDGQSATIAAAGQTWTVGLVDGTFPPYEPALAFADDAPAGEVVPYWVDAGLMALVPEALGLGRGNTIRCRYVPWKPATIYEPVASSDGDGVRRRAVLMGKRPMSDHPDRAYTDEVQAMRARIAELEHEVKGRRRQLEVVAQLIDDAAEYGGRNDGHLHVAVEQALKAAKLARGPWTACV